MTKMRMKWFLGVAISLRVGFCWVCVARMALVGATTAATPARSINSTILRLAGVNDKPLLSREEIELTYLVEP